MLYSYWQLWHARLAGDIITATVDFTILIMVSMFVCPLFAGRLHKGVACCFSPRSRHI